MMERLPRRWWERPGAVMLAVGGLVSGCGPPAPAEIALDLHEALPSALIATEPARIDLGTVAARPHLGRGWYYDERNRTTGDTFVWSRGDRSEIDLHLGWRRDLTMHISVRPLRYPGAAPQTIAFELNGRPVGDQFVLAKNGSRLSLVLPADLQAVGRNRLLARYGRVDAPADVIEGSTDQRLLAVAWSEIVIEGVDATTAEATNDAVVLPAGAWADTFVEIVPGSVLRLESCASAGDSPSTVELSVLEEGDRGATSVSLECPCDRFTVPLADRAGLVRFRVGVRPADEHVGTPTGVRLHGLEILSPATDDAVDEGRAAAGDDPADRPRPNVVIYLVDALRSDRLGAYGCDRPLSPRLDAMAAEGITFTDVTAQSSWTKAAVASIFTGLWPRAHGVNGPDDQLPVGLPTLPEHLHAAGYRTGAIVANAYVGRQFGFARGFDHFEFLEHTRGRSEVIHERVEAWLDARDPGDGPFFLYVHTIDPHAPYAPPSPFLEAFASDVADRSVGQVDTVRGLVLGTVTPTPDLGRDLRDLYDGEVAANDASFGRLLDTLEAMNELDDTLVIFTSDHGEAFGEHGSWTHGLDLYREVLSIPLVIRLPGGAGGGHRVATPVQHIDIMPTVLNRCGIVLDDPLPGAALLDRAGLVEPDRTRDVLAYLDYWGRKGASVRREGWKLIRPLSDEFGREDELYRDADDPLEVNELAAGAPVRHGWLAAQLAVALRTETAAVPTEVDDDVREQLEALGYLQ